MRIGNEENLFLTSSNLVVSANSATLTIIVSPRVSPSASCSSLVQCWPLLFCSVPSVCFSVCQSVCDAARDRPSTPPQYTLSLAFLLRRPLPPTGGYLLPVVLLWARDSGSTCASGFLPQTLIMSSRELSLSSLSCLCLQSAPFHLLDMHLSHS